MTDDFIILSDAELNQVSGGGAFPFVHPVTPSGHHGWFVPQAPIGAITLFNNPDLYRRGTSTAKAF